MPSPLLPVLLFLLICFPTLSKPKSDATIKLGSSITADNSNIETAAWFSPSRLFAFGFYAVGNGYAVGIWFVPTITVVWTADRDGELFDKGIKLTLNEDGLHIPSANGDRSIGNISTSAKLSSASMLDSGNFIIMDVSSDTIWQTFDYPTDTLIAGQILLAGNKLVSGVSAMNQSSGRFQFAMLEDGNFVARPVNTPDTSANFYWSYNTSGDGYTGILLDENGSLFPIRGDPNITHNSTQLSSSTNYLARIEPDGFLRIYNTSSNFKEPLTELPDEALGANKCSVKGACGPNSYCDLVKGEAASCICFPGFDYADMNNQYMGCERNFSMGQCVADNNNVSYSIIKLTNVSWSDDPYAYIDNSTETDCNKACFEDCNCYAALLFTHRRCSMQRHPLLYGKSMASAVAFLKVGSGEIQQLPLQPPPGEVVVRVPRNRTLLLAMAIASVSIAALAVTVFFLYTYRGPSYQKLCRNMETGLAGGLAPRSFTYQQLVAATDGFTKILGKGGFSTVFEGEIPLNKDEAVPIAVKRLDKKLSTVNEKGFRTEMRTVGRAHHRNVVRLLGFCHEGPKWLLIYEYMSRGSLASIIFPPDETLARPTWKKRTDIAMDVARGLLYLHEGCETTIIHSDIKPENVFVGDDGTAKIGDLGLAKLLKPLQSKTYTGPRGTGLYKAPEWGKEVSEPVSPKVDVYSFGVLMLELITFRKHLLREVENGCIILSDLAFKCLRDSTLKQLVPGGEDVDDAELERTVMIALWCVQKTPGQRKSMKEVVRMLGGKMSVPMPPDSVF